MEKININYLIENGIPKAIFWNCAYKDKKIDRDKLIVFSIKRGCDLDILKTYIDLFGFDYINNLLIKSESEFESKYFFNLLKNMLKELSPHK